MQYDELTPEEQAQLQDLLNSQRAFDVLMAQVTKLGATLNSAWYGGTSSVVGKLDANAVIPNTSGYVGAQGIVAYDVSQAMIEAMVISDPARPIMGTDDTGGGYNSTAIKQRRVKFCGINGNI